MPETIFNNLPVWARSYAPKTAKFNESFNVGVKISTLTSSIQPITIQDSFTVKFNNTKLDVGNSKTQFEAPNPQGVIFQYWHNRIVVNRPVGFFGVVIDAKGYKKDEVQYMRQFPTDSFPLGVVSLDKAGRSVYSQRLQYGKQVVIAPQIVQMLSIAGQLGQSGVSNELDGFSLDAVNGRLYYPEIMADLSFLVVHESCNITFDEFVK